MSKVKFWDLIKKGSGDFKPYTENENSFRRLARIQLVAICLIAPIYSMYVYSQDIPLIYFWLGVSYSAFMGLYILLCWIIPVLSDKLIWFFVVHLFGMTFAAFLSFYQNGMREMEFICFFALYSVTIFVIQRWYPTVLYTIFVLILLIYGFQNTPNPEMNSGLAYALFAVLAMSSTLVLYSRDRLINGIEDYSDYLKKIINNPGSGYILFNFNDGSPTLLDFNTEALREFGVQFNEGEKVFKKSFFSQFDSNELDEIEHLNYGSNYTKTIHLSSGTLKELQLHFNILQLKNGKYWLVKIKNVTQELRKRRELEINEKKYRNLYYQNKAGVFTIDKNSVIIDGNNSFFSMLENLINKGDKLFSNNLVSDWEFVLETMGSGESLQNYQMQFQLPNNIQKTFIFSWYLDSQTSYIEGSVIDLTTIQKATLALRQSEQKYRAIYEESNDAILLLDEDIIIDVNRRSIQLFGKSEEELLHKNLFDLSFDVSSENQVEYTNFKRLLINKRSTKLNWKFDGNNRLVEVEVAFIEIILEDKLYYQCVIHDQTELNRTIRSIEQNRKNFENILENNPEGILILHNDEVLYKNSETGVILGKDFSLQKLFSKEDQVRFNELYASHKETGNHENIQLKLISRSRYLQEVDVTMVSTNYEEKPATLIIIKDISDRNILAKEKLRAEVAEEMNKKLEKEIMERIRAEQLVQEQFLRTKAILNSSSNTFLLTLTLKKEISSYNTHFEKYFQRLIGIHAEEGLKFDYYFKNIFTPVQRRYFRIMFWQVVCGNSHQAEVQIIRPDRSNWLEIFMNPIFDTKGRVAEISIVAHDISEKKKSNDEMAGSLKEKEVMLKEIHHRVKNNLQIISSILNLQSSFVTDENTLEILQESRNRIRSMAIIHENLYRTEDFSSINFADYLMNLVTNLIASYRIRVDIELSSEIEKINLLLDQAIPCGLLANELITNSLKYAWPNDEDGKIIIQLKQEGSQVSLLIGDNGIGLPKKFNEMNSDTLGLQLVLTLVEQLDGELTVNLENGTEYLIKFDNLKPSSNGKN